MVKFNTNGDIIWTNQIGTIYDIPQSVTLDTHNNIYVTGSTRGSLDGSSRSSFDRDVFLIKFNDNGSLIWSKQFGINGDEIGYSIAIDNENQIYITGKAGNNLDGKGTATGREFIVKYLPDGTQDWLKQLGNIGSSISVNNLGELVVAGSVSGDLNGNKNAGGEDFFL